ncbi:hypothetical protein AYR57_06215 [Pediococcus claussenii]|nr:hypothetical protein AYR57_06215 [Pediococcus claussenii]ANZ72344.1 hypothetical protein AYR58_06225 [Pediococcus claussenii]
MSKNTRAFGVLFIVALVVVSPIFFNKIGIMGVDSYFHYNRIYEAAMQIKNHNFSFLNLYSFQEAGRVVNQVYSPLITYLFGGLLLLCGNWFRFQVVSIVLVTLLSGETSYFAAKRLNLNFKTSVSIAVVYMTSLSIYSFIYSANWRAIAMAFVPLLVGPIIDFYKGDWSLKSMSVLGVAVALIAQAQILAAALAIPILVPFFVMGLLKSQHKLRSLEFTLIGIAIALVLSLNFIMPYLELVRGNHLLPPVATPLESGVTNLVIPFTGKSIPLSDTILSFVFYLDFAGLIFFWKRVSGLTKVISIVAIVYIILGTSIIPWQALNVDFPALGNFLQIPRRFTITGISFLMLGTGLIVKDLVGKDELSSMADVSNFVFTMFAVASVVSLTVTVTDWVKTANNPSVGLAAGLSTNHNYIYPRTYHGKKITKIAELQPTFHTKNYGALIHAVDRITPDYTPIKHYSSSTNYYAIYKKRVVLPKNKFEHSVKAGGTIQLKWEEQHRQKINVPVVAYKNSQVRLNGQILNKEDYKTSSIGTIKIHGKKGINKVDVSYQPSTGIKVGIAVATFSWLCTILGFGVVILRKHR